MKLQFSLNRCQAITIHCIMACAGLLFTTIVQAQTVLDTARTWSSTQQIDLYSGHTISDTVTIYMSGSTIRLTNKSVRREFPVSNIVGSWTEFMQPGQVTFDVQVLDLAGKGRLVRENGVLSLTIDLSERKDWMKQKFILNPGQL